MASRTVNPSGIQTTIYHHGLYLHGSEQALLSAKVCTPDQLPGVPGNRLRTVTIVEGQHVDARLKEYQSNVDPNRREIRIARTSPRGLTVYLSQAEFAARSDGFPAFMTEVTTAKVLPPYCTGGELLSVVDYLSLPHKVLESANDVLDASEEVSDALAARELRLRSRRA